MLRHHFCPGFFLSWNASLQAFSDQVFGFVEADAKQMPTKGLCLGELDSAKKICS
jgi:hypothetical protein